MEAKQEGVTLVRVRKAVLARVRKAVQADGKKQQRWIEDALLAALEARKQANTASTGGASSIPESPNGK